MHSVMCVETWKSTEIQHNFCANLLNIQVQNPKSVATESSRVMRSVTVAI